MEPPKLKKKERMLRRPTGLGRRDRIIPLSFTSPHRPTASRSVNSSSSPAFVDESPTSRLSGKQLKRLQGPASRAENGPQTRSPGLVALHDAFALPVLALGTEGQAAEPSNSVNNTGNAPPDGQVQEAALHMAAGPPMNAENTTVCGYPVAEEYLGSCRFLQYDPARPSETANLQVLVRLGQCFGGGITKTELRQILRRCKACRNLIYVDKCGVHKCGGQELQVEDPLFDLVATLRSPAEHRGFNHQNLKYLLAICHSCDRVVLGSFFILHTCGGVQGFFN